MKKILLVKGQITLGNFGSLHFFFLSHNIDLSEKRPKTPVKEPKHQCTSTCDLIMCFMT